MKSRRQNLFHAFIALLILVSPVGLWAQGRFAPVAPSFPTDNNEARAILAIRAMLDAYKQGVPGTGGSFPEESAIVNDHASIFTKYPPR